MSAASPHGVQHVSEYPSGEFVQEQGSLSGHVGTGPVSKDTSRILQPSVDGQSPRAGVGVVGFGTQPGGDAVLAVQMGQPDARVLNSVLLGIGP